MEKWEVSSKSKSRDKGILEESKIDYIMGMVNYSTMMALLKDNSIKEN